MQVSEKAARIPLHSFLVHFPVGLWLTSFILDALVLLQPDQTLLAQTSTVLLWSGVLSGALAAMFGWRDYEMRVKKTSSEAFRAARTHLYLNSFLILWYGILGFFRAFFGSFFGEMTGAHFLMAMVGFGTLMRSTILGGQLVFTYGIGRAQSPSPSEREGLRPEPERAA